MPLQKTATMSGKTDWRLICKHEESYIFTEEKVMKIVSRKLGVAMVILIASATWVWAQNFAKQSISFSLFDKNGQRLTEAAVLDSTIRVYSLREEKVAKEQTLTYDKEKQLFTFSESTVSPGISLAFVSPTDTMYISLFGRMATGRVIDGITVQRGSYVLTSNEFSGNKHFKITSWENYLEDEEPAAKQNLSAYAHQLKSKKRITLVQTNNQ